MSTSRSSVSRSVTRHIVLSAEITFPGADRVVLLLQVLQPDADAVPALALHALERVPQDVALPEVLDHLPERRENVVEPPGRMHFATAFLGGLAKRFRRWRH